MEKEYVYKTYEIIAKEFDDTRYCKWNSVINFLNSLPDYSLVADVGCGNGKYMKYLNHHYIGIDTCKNLIDIVKENVIYGNALDLPYRDNSFDAVISVAVLHHISNFENRRRFLEEIMRILKPGGVAHVTVWADTLKKKNMIDLGNNDYLIGWKNKYQRYYHLFKEKELHDLCKRYSYKIGYEMENWYLTITKIIL